MSFVCRRKYSLIDNERTVIKTSLIVAPYCFPFSLNKSMGMLGLIAACLTGESFWTIALSLNPLFSFGRTTTVKNEHHKMFSGNIKYSKSWRAYEILTVILGTSLMSGLSYRLKFISMIAIPSATE